MTPRTLLPRPVPRGAVAPIASVALVLLVAAGCGGGSGSSGSASGSASASGSSSDSGGASASPSSAVSLPAGVSLTEAGTTLSFGGAATVAFEPNAKKSTALTLTVTKVARGRIADLSAYRLDASTKTSTPYYATVKVSNVGTGDVGRSAIPLWGLSSADTLIGASGFTNSFAKCPSRPLPQRFAAGAELTTCLMYLVPKGGTLAGVSYRPLMRFEPIVWKGTITAPARQRQNQKQKQSTKG